MVVPVFPFQVRWPYHNFCFVSHRTDQPMNSAATTPLFQKKKKRRRCHKAVSSERTVSSLVEKENKDRWREGVGGQ